MLCMLYHALSDGGTSPSAIFKKQQSLTVNVKNSMKSKLIQLDKSLMSDHCVKKLARNEMHVLLIPKILKGGC